MEIDAILTKLQKGGEPVSMARLPIRRDAAPFELLRRRSDLHLEKFHKRPQVHLLREDNFPNDPRRLTFLKNFLAVGGMEWVPCETKDDLVGKVVVLCASDEHYLSFGAELITKIRTMGAEAIAITGKSSKPIGADFQIHLKCDAIEILNLFLDFLGVKK